MGLGRDISGSVRVGAAMLVPPPVRHGEKQYLYIISIYFLFTLQSIRNMTTHEAKAEFATGSSVSVSLSLRSSLSRYHIHCAVLCAKQSRDLEKKYTGQSFNEIAPLFDDDVAYVTGVVLSSVAYLEAKINEFFKDCQDFTDPVKTINPTLISALNSQVDITLNKCSKRYNHYSSPFCKYALAYNILTNQEIPTDNGSLGRDILDLIKLRNELVHYKSHFQSDDGKDPYKINHLEGRFEENVFMRTAGNPFFPKKCLGFGCAKWSIEKSIKFIEFFFSEVSPNRILLEQKYLEFFNDE